MIIKRFFSYQVLLKQALLILKSFHSDSSLTGYQHTFACKQIYMLSKWMSEDSIFILNIVVVSQTETNHEVTFIVYNVYVGRFWRGEIKKRKVTANAALINIDFYRKHYF